MDSENISTCRCRGKRKADSNDTVTPTSQIIAHRLNNQAVHHIHCRQYEAAISDLGGAINQSQSEESFQIPHPNPLSVILKHHFGNSSSSRRTTSVTSRGIVPGDIDERDDINSTRECNMADTVDIEFIYSKGIKVCSESQALATGQTFHVVLLFNLALAHHLSWARRKDISDVKRLNHIVQLYEFTYRLAIQARPLEIQVSPDSYSDLCNMRFTLAIINNLAQIHRALNGGPRYHHGVLEDLLSHLMVVATVQQHHSSLNTARRRAGSEEQREAINTIEIDLDGFFRNVLPLVLKSNSAGAA